MNHRYKQLYYKSKFTSKKLDKYFKRVFKSRVPSEREVIIYPTPIITQTDLLLESARKAWLAMTNKAINTNKDNV